MARIFYSPAYVASRYAFDTTRKAALVAQSLSRAPIPGIELVAPPSLAREDLVAVHDLEYVRAVETGEPRELAESQGFPWDSGMWPMVLASNGGVVAAMRTAMEDGVAGSLSSGLHHARRDRGAAFCTFNGLAIAAHEALGAGAGIVLILDLDAHCGGGTASLIADQPRIRQIDVAVSAVDWYSSSEQMWLDVVDDSRNYLPVIRRRLDQADRQGLRFGMCLYNAGMDPHQDCLIGGLPGIDRRILAERERMVFEWCRKRGLPMAFVLAGGYAGGGLDQTALIDLHRLTLSAAVAGGADRAPVRPGAD